MKQGDWGMPKAIIPHAGHGKNPSMLMARGESTLGESLESKNRVQLFDLLLHVKSEHKAS